jgi:hypothetical protein
VNEIPGEIPRKRFNYIITIQATLCNTLAGKFQKHISQDVSNGGVTIGFTIQNLMQTRWRQH